ncbi:MAG: MATE family efflux transporter, partial [Bacteroidales bacterium]|nr:MATE family efflux transporter [Bacteroidales bacterium]
MKRHSPILRIALPSIVSNITVPLLGLVDAAIAGHLGDAVYLAAIALGGMMFNMM